MLDESYGGAQGLADTHLDERYVVVERAFTQITSRLSSLADLWRAVLGPEAYSRAMGDVADAMLVRITDGVLALKDIGVDETHRLHGLLSGVAECVVDLFDEHPPQPTDSAVGAARADLAPLQLPQLPSWTRFLQVRDILELSLAEIADRWLGANR